MAEDQAPEVPGRLTLIGTGHVFRIEETVRDAIVALAPDVVFIELDRGRLQALLYKRRHGSLPPSKGSFVHRRLQRFQEAIAKRYGSDVGGEMLGAVAGGQAVGARIVLIDQGADQTVRKALQALTWSEKLRGVGMLVGGGLRSLLPGKRPDIDDEVRKYQEDPQAALDELARRFPSIKRVVIDERDELMAAHIIRALPPGAHGVAVVGDGHVPGMTPRLDAFEITTYRLPEVRAGALPKPELATGDGRDVSFGHETEWPPQSS